MDKNNILSWLIALLLVGGLISLIIISKTFALLFTITNFIVGSYILKMAIKEILTNKTKHDASTDK